MRLWRDPSIRWCFGALSATVALTAGAIGGAAANGDADRDDSAITCPGAWGRTGALRACLEDSVVFLTSELGGLGTGLLLHDGFVITNAHVIGMAAEVDVEFVDGVTVEDAAVVGIDAATDLALIDVDAADRDGIHLAPLPVWTDSNEPDVFLVGFPGGVEPEAPALTVAAGVVSRVRRHDAFAQTYLQSDAAIAGGQSGGALVDGNGRVLGVSGYFAFGFSFSLSVDDVIEVVDRFAAEPLESAPLLPELGPGDEAEQWVRVGDSFEGRRIIVPAGPARTLEVAVSASDFSIDVSTVDGIGLGSANQFGGVDDAGGGFDQPEPWFTRLDAFFGPTIEIDDQSIEVDIPDDVPVIVTLVTAQARRVRVTMNEPFVVVDAATRGDDVVLGEPLTDQIDRITGRTRHALDVDAGDEITITITGTPTTPSVELLEPTTDITDISPGFGFGGLASGVIGLGFVDLEVEHRFRIERAAEFDLVVSGQAGEYTLVVTRERPDE